MSFIIEKVVLLPCIPEYRKKNSNSTWFNLFSSKLVDIDRDNVPTDVINIFENQKYDETIDYNDIHKDINNNACIWDDLGYLIYGNKYYSFTRVTYNDKYHYKYKVADTFDEDIKKCYDNCLPLLKDIEKMVGLEITKKDLPLCEYSGVNINGLYVDNIEPITVISVVQINRQFVDKLTDFCELHCKLV